MSRVTEKQQQNNNNNNHNKTKKTVSNINREVYQCLKYLYKTKGLPEMKGAVLTMLMIVALPVHVGAKQWNCNYDPQSAATRIHDVAAAAILDLQRHRMREEVKSVKCIDVFM